MDKLKKKVFFTISCIVTLFLVIILAIFNYQDYIRELNSVENNLNRMKIEKNDIHERLEEINEFRMEEIEERNDSNFPKKIFVDSTIYTVILNDNNEIVNIINHSENSVTESEIRNIANEIIKSNVKEGARIGNLYIDNYSYSYNKDKTLTIIDNSKTRENLQKNLKISVGIFILLEIIIIYVSKRITDWATRPAVEALEAQKQFIADASHELKTPLAVILASSEALENDYQEKWIDNIKSEAERMSRLITNLLNLARIENVKDKVTFSKNDLSKIVKNSTLTFEGLIYEKKIELEVNIEKDISLNCDSDEIKQLVGILLDNAIKHSIESGKIIVSLRKEKNNIIFEVKNKGQAIPKEEQQKIFERFYRADEARNRDDNRYGLGLAIAKGIVEKHEGSISASSENGFTTFKINFKI